MVSWGRGESQRRETGQHAEDGRQAHVTGVVTSGRFPSLGHSPDIALVLLLGESTFSSTLDRWCLYRCPNRCSRSTGVGSKLEWGHRVLPSSRL